MNTKHENHTLSCRHFAHQLNYNQWAEPITREGSRRRLSEMCLDTGRDRRVLTASQRPKPTSNYAKRVVMQWKGLTEDFEKKLSLLHAPYSIFCTWLGISFLISKISFLFKKISWKFRTTRRPCKQLRKRRGSSHAMKRKKSGPRACPRPHHINDKQCRRP